MAALLAAVGCEKQLDLAWSVQVGPSPTDPVVRVRATIEPGSCGFAAAAPIYTAEDVRAASPPERLAEGRYAFRAQAVSENCTVLAEDCRDVVLDGGGVQPEQVVLSLFPSVEGRPLCDADRCFNGFCASVAVDAAVPPIRDAGADANDAAAPDTSMMPEDAGFQCQPGLGPVCMESTLVTCEGTSAVETDCPAGCGNAACLTLAPRLLAPDVCTTLPDTALMLNQASMEGTECTTVRSGDGEQSFCAFVADTIVIDSRIRFRGDDPILLLAREVRVEADIDMAGRNQLAAPPGMVNSGSASGGGGAGHASVGGAAGPQTWLGMPEGGPAYGSCAMDSFEGGSSTGFGDGGRTMGGGAIYIVGCESVFINAVVDAGGAGAASGFIGAGSGGTIFVEGGQVNLAAGGVLAVAGGGGGAGRTRGENGRTDGTAAMGAMGGDEGGMGGPGGIDSNAPSAATASASGGGAAGFIRVESNRATMAGEMHGVICQPMGISTIP